MKQPIRCAHVDDAVDRLLAGAVPPDEDALLRGHAVECESCDALLARLDGLVEGPPSPPEPDDLARRRGFLAMEAKLRETPPRIGWRPMAIAAAAVFAALGVGLLVGGNRGTQPARIASVETEPQGVRWVAPPGGSATFDLGGGTRIVMSEGATARVVGVDGPTLELQLASGLLVGELSHHGAVRRIEITAPRGRIEVTGTQFAVRATRDDDVVAVREGVVQVVAGRRHSQVRAGQARSLETLELVDAARLASIWSLLGTTEASAQTAAISAGPAVAIAPEATDAPRHAATPLPVIGGRVPNPNAGSSAPVDARAARIADLRLKIDRGETDAIFDLGQELRTSNPTEADRLFNQYDATGGQYTQRALQYRILINEHRNPALAKTLAERYITRYPAGSFTNDAHRVAGH